MTLFGLPQVGKVAWRGTERDTVEVEDHSGTSDWRFDARPGYISSEIDFYAERLSALLAAQEFVAAESEQAKWDCAGERAFVAHRKIQIRSPFALSWDELTVAQRDYWVAVAKAVLDE